MSAERLTLSAIQSVVQQLSQSGLGEIEVTGQHWAIRVTCCPKGPSGTMQGAMPTEAADFLQNELKQDRQQQDKLQQITIKAKAAGNFLRHHPGQQTEFTQVGDAVTKGQLIGLLKIGPVYLPIYSPCHGLVAAIHSDDGSVVGFDAELITINQ